MSAANYIIICAAKTDYATSKDTGAKIRALSDGAATLVAHIDITRPKLLSESDYKPVSDLQHYLMDNAATISSKELDERAAQMFAYLDELEKAAGE